MWHHSHMSCDWWCGRSQQSTTLAAVITSATECSTDLHRVLSKRRWGMDQCTLGTGMFPYNVLAGSKCRRALTTRGMGSVLERTCNVQLHVSACSLHTPVYAHPPTPAPAPSHMTAVSFPTPLGQSVVHNLSLPLQQTACITKDTASMYGSTPWRCPLPAAAC